ncbi:TfoX/Sxy family protein [Lysobacter sp. CA196]|uniref:TfoX/Sxy family protein n=1 Tax=Lysobacter sp. CA196 TaxID=3455606 RepID=UPI003F8D325B
MSEALIAHLRDLASGFGALSARGMFGGHGVYHDGLMIALIIDEAVYLKVDTQTAPRFRAAGCEPFVYTRQRKPIELSFWSVPESAMDSPQDMKPWLVLAYQAALRKANAAPPKKAGVKKTAAKKTTAKKTMTKKAAAKKASRRVPAAHTERE